MNKLGETRKAKEVNKFGSSRYIWSACLDCNKERWVLLGRNGARNKRCGHCACLITSPLKVKRGHNHPNWKGGRYIGVNGYVVVRVDKSSPFYSMSNTGDRIYEHRLVMAQLLGRTLDKTEIVHHLNGEPTDNRLENLCITNSKEHDRQALVKQLRRRIRELEGKK